jgi:KUP system potassium uptake protein
MRANVEHNHLLHERVVIVSARTVNAPFVPPGERVTVDVLGDGIVHVAARFGF